MLKSYYIPNDRSAEGYAYIVIDTDAGFFSTVSDWGNYAYRWSHPGCEFRKFLVGLEPDYLLRKLMSGRPDMQEYDDKRTMRSIFERLRGLAQQISASRATSQKRAPSTSASATATANTNATTASTRSKTSAPGTR